MPMSVIDDYLKNVPPIQKATLEHIRTLVKQLAPTAEEVISYGMPGFKLNHRYMLGFAAFKDHLSLFPTSQPMSLLSQDVHDKFVTSKGTLQFTPEDPLPDSVIKQIIQERIKDISKK
jgi:uncharacterized protein YdhG (YjbR/CyaY superfamily)